MVERFVSVPRGLELHLEALNVGIMSRLVLELFGGIFLSWLTVEVG